MISVDKVSDNSAHSDISDLRSIARVSRAFKGVRTLHRYLRETEKGEESMTLS